MEEDYDIFGMDNLSQTSHHDLDLTPYPGAAEYISKWLNIPALEAAFEHRYEPIALVPMAGSGSGGGGEAEAAYYRNDSGVGSQMENRREANNSVLPLLSAHRCYDGTLTAGDSGITEDSPLTAEEQQGNQQNAQQSSR